MGGCDIGVVVSQYDTLVQALGPLTVLYEVG